MFCSSCGAESNPGLQYCKRCGASLMPAGLKDKPTGLVWIVAFGIAMMMGLPMGGIVVIFERLSGLLDKGFPLYFLITLASVSLMMVALATVLLSRLLSPIFKNYLQSGEPSESKKTNLGERRPAQISAPPDSVSSVTEGTTRTFEPRQVERETD